jgi:hypothetical protein
MATLLMGFEAIIAAEASSIHVSASWQQSGDHHRQLHEAATGLYSQLIVPVRESSFSIFRSNHVC